MSKHTPGPWEASEIDDGFDCGHVIRMGESIASPYHYASHHRIEYDHGCDPEDNRDQFEEAEANARLIAAAPDLLEAARVILASIDEQGTPLSRSAIEDTPLRAAIAKAEGAK